MNNFTSCHQASFVASMIFLVFSFYLVTDEVSAEYKKKVAFGSFSNPEDWVETYDPSLMIRNLLEKIFRTRDKFEVVEIFENSAGSSLPYQYLIRGSLLEFQPNLESVPLVETGIGQKLKKGKVTIKLELSVESSLTRKPLVRKIISSIMPASRIPFYVREGQTELDETTLDKSDIGGAIKKMITQSVKIIESSLKDKSFEAMIIEVFPEFSVESGKQKINQDLKIDQNKNLRIELKKKPVGFVKINAGWKHGVEFRGRFYVYSVIPDFVDPLTNYDLGDAWEKIGVVRVHQVQENYSIAIVEAGEGFAKGQIIRPYRKRLGIEGGIKPWWIFQLTQN